MYTIDFEVERFSSNLAWSAQRFEKLGRARVRVEEIEGGYYDPLTEVRRFRAKSRKPFVVVVTTKAGGQDAHLDGDLAVLVAAVDSRGRHRAVPVIVNGREAN
ncbi:MAG: hypothetical protein HY397_02410 [Candidatus Doudnabacteria bacterium]|nr:hypothetical protein [Candidatus Doudnabacteria bacterium]